MENNFKYIIKIEGWGGVIACAINCAPANDYSRPQFSGDGGTVY